MCVRILFEIEGAVLSNKKGPHNAKRVIDRSSHQKITDQSIKQCRPEKKQKQSSCMLGEHEPAAFQNAGQVINACRYIRYAFHSVSLVSSDEVEQSSRRYQMMALHSGGRTVFLRK